MYTFLSIVYVLVCSFLIMVVLLQQGRGGGMGSLGGGGGQTVFGGSGAGNLLTRLTTISAALFMILSATLAWMSSRGDSALEEAMTQRERDATNHEQLDEALHHEDGETTPATDHATPTSDHATPPAEVPSTEGAAPAAEAPPPPVQDELEAAPSGPATEGEHAPSAPPPSAL